MSGREGAAGTGYSLGAAYTNITAKYADTLAGGVFANSNYIAHAVPCTYEGNDRVLDIGYENDIVHRAAGDFDSLGEALQVCSGLMGQDYALGSSTDNLILFGDDYADPAWPYGSFALYDLPGGWAAHVAGLTSDAMPRITQSAFLIGSQYDDRLRGNVGNDDIDAMAGDDTIRPGDGQNRIEGESGADTLEVSGTMRDWSVSRLADGTTAFFSRSRGLDIASGVERVTFPDAGIPGLGRSYALESDRLEDLTWSGSFEFLDQDVAYTAARPGTAGNDTLTGSRVFGIAGNDVIAGTSARDLLYGGEGNDWRTGGGGSDLFNGGPGDDLVVVDARLSGRVTIEDFRLSDVEQDRIRIVGGTIRSDTELRNHGKQTADGLLLHLGASDVMIEHATWSTLTPGTVSFG